MLKFNFHQFFVPNRSGILARNHLRECRISIKLWFARKLFGFARKMASEGIVSCSPVTPNSEDKARRRRTSFVWDYFTISPNDIRKAICNNCGSGIVRGKDPRYVYIDVDSRSVTRSQSILFLQFWLSQVEQLSKSYIVHCLLLWNRWHQRPTRNFTFKYVC